MVLLTRPVPVKRMKLFGIQHYQDSVANHSDGRTEKCDSVIEHEAR